MGLETALTIGISVLSLLLAGLALGWNVYRDVVLKPSLKVRFGVSELVTSRGRDMGDRITVSATNLGPGEISCAQIIWKDTSLWKWLTRRSRSGIVFRDFEDPVSADLPTRLRVGERTTFTIPFKNESLLGDKVSHVGILDTFGRKHWASHDEVVRAKQEHQKAFGEPDA